MSEGVSLWGEVAVVDFEEVARRGGRLWWVVSFEG